MWWNEIKISLWSIMFLSNIICKWGWCMIKRLLIVEVFVIKWNLLIILYVGSKLCFEFWILCYYLYKVLVVL